MPASPCRTYTNPKEKAAWEALDSMEKHLESTLLAAGVTAEVNGMAYFIAEDGQLRCAPMLKDGSIDKDQAMHRNDYEGLSAEEMKAIKDGIVEWIARLPDGDSLTAENYARLLQWNGFEVISTGGGVTAWSRTLPSGYHILVTNESEGHTFNSYADTVIVGVYDSDSQPIRQEWEGPLSSARIAIALQGAAGMERALESLDKEAVVEDALDAAVKSIQNALGVKTGDMAGMFFSGEMHEMLRKPLRQYMDLELEMFRPDFDSENAPGENLRQRPRG